MEMTREDIQLGASLCLKDLADVVKNYDEESVATACCYLICRIIVKEVPLDRAIEMFTATYREVQREQSS